MNLVNSLLWWGYVDLDLILIGCSDSFVVTSLITPAVIYLIKNYFNLEEMNRQLKKEIADRILAEEALRKSEMQYHALVETTNTGFVIVDGEGKVLDANTEYVRLTGNAELGEIIGKSVLEWTSPADREKNADAVRRCREEGHVRNLELDYVDSQGRTIPIEIHATLVERDGAMRIFAICRDITDRRTAQEESHRLRERLNRSEKMEALGHLAGGVAHDLNNVLGVSMGYSELMKEMVPEGSELRSYVNNIFYSTEKGAAIIQDLLTLARRGVTVSAVVDLGATVSNVLRSPEFDRLKNHHPAVSFREEIETDLLYIMGSPVHLEKSIFNLLSNAAEAINGKGEVVLRMENRYLDNPLQGYDAVKEGDYVVLSISDNGGGIGPDDINKIFEPFYTKKKMGRSGTGLGLAIVWGTVKDHEGYIDVQSAVGEGTCFTLFFPVTREKPAIDHQEIPVEQFMGRGESVLVVDDVQGQRQVATIMLQRLGYRVHAVAGGEEAIEYLKGNKADILVLDMIMEPGIDGLETFRRVREIKPGQKAIIVSGFSETDRVREAQALGAGSYVRKPYIMEKIGLAIRKELDS